MICFNASDLRPVLIEARSQGCSVVLVKDQGVYMMSEKSDATANGQPRLIAYAVGCNPDTVHSMSGGIADAQSSAVTISRSTLIRTTPSLTGSSMTGAIWKFEPTRVICI
ncbi:hypothetical protein QFZ94_004591 [Paraburkholderia sp. JPY465]